MVSFSVMVLLVINAQEKKKQDRRYFPSLTVTFFEIYVAPRGNGSIIFNYAGSPFLYVERRTKSSREEKTLERVFFSSLAVFP